MPAWAPLLTTDEMIAVVNHVRRAWDHDASTLHLRHRLPPPAIARLEVDMAGAIQSGHASILAAVAWPPGSRPVLIRPEDAPGGTVGRDDPPSAMGGLLQATGQAQCEQLHAHRHALTTTRKRPLSGKVPSSWGRGASIRGSRTPRAARRSCGGEALRVYRRYRGRWVLALDYAALPFEVGFAVKPRALPMPPMRGGPWARDHRS